MANGLKKQSSLMRFIGNKNVVTIVGIAACIVVLVVGFTYRVNNSVSTTSVPFAKKSLKAREIIKESDIGTVRISTNYTSKSNDIIKDSRQVVSKAVAYYSNIPAGSLFYTSAVMDPKALPNASFKDIGENKTIYSFAVNANTTYSNSIRAGDYIDLYMFSKDPFTDDKIVFGCLIESIRVLAVKDSKGRNIVKNSLAYGTPAELLFDVDDDLFILLSAAEFIDGITIEPVLHNAAYTKNNSPDNVKVSSEYLRQIIENKMLILN